MPAPVQNPQPVQPVLPSRRSLLAAGAACAAAPLFIPSRAWGANDSITLGFIGVGSRGMAHVNGLTGRKNVEALAVCDVDKKYLDLAQKTVNDKNKRIGREVACAAFERYEDLIARKDIDAVVITTPDHWHTKIAIEAMKTGKDVYCEKPLTLTIDEGKQILKVLNETQRIFQVGTQQRSGRQFLETVAFVRAGGLGKIKTVSCSIGGGDKGGPFKKSTPPAHLDWDRWQGQTPAVDYIDKRCHYQFRWWYEYSGGKMTDWGAHHVDIAQWGIGMEKSGPLTVEGLSAEHQMPFKDGYPTKDDLYNTATSFKVRAAFANDVNMIIQSGGQNGITFEGESGTVFVSRDGKTGTLNGKRLPVTTEQIAAIYGDEGPIDHYENWLRCIKSRKQPVSDVASHHRILSTCHLANIAIRLGAKLNYDPEAQQITGNDAANAFLKRTQRAGYEINA